MPKISEERRQARRDQILAAVWRCFLRKGVHGTSMEEIILESGLSAGAVYTHFTGKNELILAAISIYMGRLRGLQLPVLMREDILSPVVFVHDMIAVINRHTKRVGIDLNPVIMMGWSEAQTNKGVRQLVNNFQVNYREALTRVVQQWCEKGYLPSAENPEDIAKALLSFFLGAIAQQALLGGAELKC